MTRSVDCATRATDLAKNGSRGSALRTGRAGRTRIGFFGSGFAGTEAWLALNAARATSTALRSCPTPPSRVPSNDAISEAPKVQFFNHARQKMSDRVPHTVTE